jgi:hypothetical protein
MMPTRIESGEPRGPSWPARQLDGRHRAMTHLAMGIFLTMLGIVLTLDRLELFDASLALRWWPIGFHVLGATILARRSDSHGRFWGIAWLIVGTWLLLNSLGIVRIGFWDLLWPMVLIAIGVRLVLRGRAVNARAGTSNVSDETPSLVAVLSEAKGSVTQALSRASLTSVMGGCHLDLRQASITNGSAPVVDVFAVLGGHEIVVPPGWTVVMDVVTILAAAEDKRLPTIATVGGASIDAGAPQLTIRGTLLLSGLTIKN